VIAIDSTAVAGPPVEAVSAAAYTIATDRPESDGTFAWDSTTMVVAVNRGMYLVFINTASTR